MEIISFLVILGIVCINLSFSLFDERFFFAGLFLIVIAGITVILNFGKVVEELNILISIKDDIECYNLCKENGYDYGRLLGDKLCECITQTSEIMVLNDE